MKQPCALKDFIVYYRPQTKFEKVMFSQVSVCPQGGLPHCMLGYTPPGQTPPSGQTPAAQCMLGYDQQVGGTHPTGMHSCNSMFLFCSHYRGGAHGGHYFAYIRDIDNLGSWTHPV